jgi:hypothetical protein
VALSDDLGRIGATAATYAGPDESVAAILAVEASAGERLYVCAFEAGERAQTWLVLDDDGSPVNNRRRIREAASIAALCEIAEEATSSNGNEVHVASLERLDSFGAAAAAPIQHALPAVDELTREIEANYKVELS